MAVIITITKVVLLLAILFDILINEGGRALLKTIILILLNQYM